jgi:ribonuclease HI
MSRENVVSEGKSASLVRIFCDGAGARLDGTGSGFAWLRPDTGEKHVERQDGLTNNEAEYRSLLSAAQNLTDGSQAEIFTDSELMCRQFNGTAKVLDHKLQALLSDVRTTIGRKRLSITLQWISRQQNLAGKLL